VSDRCGSTKSVAFCDINGSSARGPKLAPGLSRVANTIRASGLKIETAANRPSSVSATFRSASALLRPMSALLIGAPNGWSRAGRVARYESPPGSSRPELK